MIFNKKTKGEGKYTTAQEQSKKQCRIHLLEQNYFYTTFCVKIKH